MKLQTHIPLTPQDNQIDYNANVALLGSCFVENIGEKLEFYKFQTLINPFGILFHPIALEGIVSRAIQNKLFTKEDLYIENERWFCFEVHASLNAETSSDLLVLLNEKLIALGDYLKSATHIVLTYGTAWVYRHLETQAIVANCNKIPQKEFEKELLSVPRIQESIQQTFNLIHRSNPKAAIISTVSPIRHIKDGFVENTQSKAHLISAIHQVLFKKSSGNAFYFPSFEMMMDELRDYRFYKEDMIHPNKTAISIIWEAFSKVWLSSKSKEIQKKVENIQARLLHKPFRPNSVEHQQFLQKLEQDISNLQKENPKFKF